MKWLISSVPISLTFLFAGCTTTAIEVDAANTSAPFDGSAAHPFPTIQQGLDAAATTLGAKVEVHPGSYTERLHMGRNNSLVGVGGDVFIFGTGINPTITVPGNDTIANIHILNGGTGIVWSWDGIGSPTAETTVTIRKCEVRGTTRAVEFKSPATLAFANDALINLRLVADGNRFRSTAGDGFNIDLRGPTAGSVALHLDVRNNIVDGGATSLQVDADERRASSGQPPSALVDGIVSNNLFTHGLNGIQMVAASRSTIAPQIIGNTIAGHTVNGILGEVDGGQFGPGGGLVQPDLERNIIANNLHAGYLEFTSRTDAKLLRNLFFGNFDGQYVNTTGSGSSANSQAINDAAGLNALPDSQGNLLADPHFVRGSAPILGTLDSTLPGPGEFFLTQTAAQTSPAVNAGGITAIDAGMASRTTRTDFQVDSGDVDLGFHFAPL
jgi:hypothetical protein